VVNSIYLYVILFIPVGHSYIIKSGFILNQIADGFEKHTTRWCDQISINISIKNPKLNRPTGRSKRRQEDNIKRILKEKVCYVKWMKITSDNAISKVTLKLNITSSYLWDPKLKSKSKASLSCLQIFVVLKFSVELVLNCGDIINRVNNIDAKKIVVRLEMLV